MKLALKWFVPIASAAMGLAWISEQVALLCGFESPPQILVKLFTDPGVAWQVKAKYAFYAVVAAPVLEELVFRLGLFNLCRWVAGKIRPAPTEGNAGFPLVPALVSGAVFAAVHLHAATFVPLWFLGVAFAWLYWKSRSVISPVICHFLFNLLNLCLCLLLGPDLAAG